MIRFLQSGNKAAKYLLGGLLTVVCASMVTYLIPGFMTDTSVNRTGVVARVGGEEITTQDVQRIVALIQQQRRYPDYLQPMLMQQGTQILIQQAELRYEGDRMGLKVSDEEVRQALHNDQFAPMFYPNGQWVGQAEYENKLREFYGTTPEEFERQLRFDLLRNKLMTTVTAGVAVTPPEIEAAYKKQNTKVKFDYAVITMDDVEKQIKPTDAELKTFYDANKARYQNSIPEKRQVRYFTISDQQVESKVTVTPTDLQQYYRDHIDQFRTQDRVRVRHILIATPTPGADGKVDPKALDAARAKAEDVLKQLKAGGDFAELAKKYSDDPGSKDKGGELGWYTKDSELVPEFKQAMLSLPKGQISGLVQSSFGFHIIQVEDKETAGMKSLAQVKDQIEPIIKQQKLAALLDQMASAAESQARSQGLDKAAAQYDAKVLESNPISRTDSLAGVGASPDLMTDIFSTEPKTGPQAVRTAQGAVIFEVQKIIPPSTPPFEEIRQRVTNDFKTERASVLLNQKTAELSDQAHASHDLKKAAKDLGATVKTSDLVTRTSQVPDIGSMSGESAGPIFGMKPGEISGPMTIGRNGIVVELIDRQEPPVAGDDFAKAKDNLREQLLQEKRQEAQELFLSNLNDRLEKEGRLKINNNEMGNLRKGRS
jgi:peptidyl-prolyl cis-trans isomerase D